MAVDVYVSFMIDILTLTASYIVRLFVQYTYLHSVLFKKTH